MREMGRQLERSHVHDAPRPPPQPPQVPRGLPACRRLAELEIAELDRQIAALERARPRPGAAPMINRDQERELLRVMQAAGTPLPPREIAQRLDVPLPAARVRYGNGAMLRVSGVRSRSGPRSQDSLSRAELAATTMARATDMRASRPYCAHGSWLMAHGPTKITAPRRQGRAPEASRATPRAARRSPRRHRTGRGRAGSRAGPRYRRRCSTSPRWSRATTTGLPLLV